MRSCKDYKTEPLELLRILHMIFHRAHFLAILVGIDYLRKQKAVLMFQTSHGQTPQNLQQMFILRSSPFLNVLGIYSMFYSMFSAY